jgi:hypothetical protein
VVVARETLQCSASLYAFPSNEPLLTAGMIEGWNAMAERRLKQSRARQELKTIEYRARLKKLSRRKNVWKNAGGAYNEFHIAAFWDKSREKAEAKQAKVWETAKPKQSRLCNGCGIFMSRHTTRSCMWGFRKPKLAGAGTKRKRS